MFVYYLWQTAAVLISLRGTLQLILTIHTLSQVNQYMTTDVLIDLRRIINIIGCWKFSEEEGIIIKDIGM